MPSPPRRTGKRLTTDAADERPPGGRVYERDFAKVRPEKFVPGMLRAIVGVEVRIERIDAKFKLSQNRPDADIDGVVAGLRSEGDERGASAVQAHRPDRR